MQCLTCYHLCSTKTEDDDAADVSIPEKFVAFITCLVINAEMQLGAGNSSRLKRVEMFLLTTKSTPIV